MEFCSYQNKVKQYLDASYIAQHKAFWCNMAYEMHFISPTVYRLDIHPSGMQNVTWNEDAAETINDIIEQAATKDTTLTV